MFGSRSRMDSNSIAQRWTLKKCETRLEKNEDKSFNLRLGLKLYLPAIAVCSAGSKIDSKTNEFKINFERGCFGSIVQESFSLLFVILQESI